MVFKYAGALNGFGEAGRAATMMEWLRQWLQERDGGA